MNTVGIELLIKVRYMGFSIGVSLNKSLKSNR
jgi:hypothetical protein